MRKRQAVAFTGPSNSGKTTLILKVARKLIHEHNMEVAIIKHDPKDKARFDTPGKDSYKFTDTGAKVVVTSPNKTTYFSSKHQEFEEIVDMFGEVDMVLVEGLKNLPLPRQHGARRVTRRIFRDKIDEEYFPYMNALAIDDSIDPGTYTLPEGVSVLDLNNEDDVITWILNNAKVV